MTTILDNDAGPCAGLGDFLTIATSQRWGGTNRRLWPLTDDDLVVVTDAVSGLSTNFASLNGALTSTGPTVTNTGDLDLPLQRAYTCAGVVISTNVAFAENNLTSSAILAVIEADTPVVVGAGDTLRIPAGSLEFTASSGTALVDAAALADFAAQLSDDGSATFDLLDRELGLRDDTLTELAGQDYARQIVDWDRTSNRRIETDSGTGFVFFPSGVGNVLPAANLEYVATWTQGGDPLASWPFIDPPTLRNGSELRSVEGTIYLEVDPA